MRISILRADGRMFARLPGGSLLLTAIVLGLCVFAGSAAAQPVVTVVMSGLDNPRGLAFGPEGALYVAESGRGGDGPAA